MNCNPQLPRYLCFLDHVNEDSLRDARSLGLVNPIMRKHSSGIELDFRFPSDPMESNLPVMLGTDMILKVEEDMSGLSPSELLEASASLVEEERYWECHNCLEELWKRSTGSDKKMLHEIIGVIVSQIKVQMGQREVGERVYNRSVGELKRSNFANIAKELPDNFQYPIKFSFDLVLEAIRA